MSVLREADYYELLVEAYVDYRKHYPRLAAHHFRHHTYHEFLWNAFNYLMIMEDLEDEL